MESGTYAPSIGKTVKYSISTDVDLFRELDMVEDFVQEESHYFETMALMAPIKTAGNEKDRSRSLDLDSDDDDEYVMACEVLLRNSANFIGGGQLQSSEGAIR